MSWVQKLYETYENCSAIAGQTTENRRPLLPLYHIVQQVQIEIVLDENGDFRKATLISKDDASTIIPCTEDSASRSGSDPQSHPLSDKLQYVAADLSNYIIAEKPELFKKLTSMHHRYRALLENWCQSSRSHEKACIVLTYVKKCSVTKDLIDYGVIKVEDNGKIKAKNMAAMVRWVVQKPEDKQDQLWKDEGLFASWHAFARDMDREKGLCYVSGTYQPLAQNHPKYIRGAGDSAKIISSNDKTGFTFRGRVENVAQACGVGIEVTQKAHNALIWLMSKQGKVFYNKKKEPGLAIVAWAMSCQSIINPLDDGYSILGLEVVVNEESSIDTAETLALRLKKRINGYGINLGNTDQIVVLGLNALTPGRLSIVFYRELTGSDFLERINNWHSSCSWIHSYRTYECLDEKTKTKIKTHPMFVGAPAPVDIAEAAYGENLDEKIRNATIERLLPCIIDGRKIPRDLVELVTNRSKNRVGMDEGEWNKTLSIACALFRKYAKDYKGVNYSMALDETRRTRDYLYGRLLAIADSIEQWALREAGENRQTAAARLMQRFADHPYTTWRTIELSLAPYKARLGGKLKNRLNLLAEVMAMFEYDDFVNDKKLNGEFLLGYHCQRDDLRKRAKSHDTKNETINNEDKL